MTGPEAGAGGLPRRFETARLRLRPLAADDRSLYVGVYTDPGVMRHVGPPLEPVAAGRAFEAALAQMRQVPAPAWYWVACLRSGGEAIGLLAVMFDPGRASAEFGMMLSAAGHGRGYATETVVALLEHAFSGQGPGRLRTRHLTAHPAVPRILGRLGFTRGQASGGMSHWFLDRDDWLRGQARAGFFATGGHWG